LRLALEQVGRRFTRQRAAVFAYLRGVESHPTAEQVFAGVRPSMPHISLATVYKALEALVAAGVAARLTNEDGIARYDGRSDSHYHLRCLNTGQVRDLPLPYDPQLLDRLAPQLAEWLRREGFELVGHRLELVGRFLEPDKK
jgi:Fe2+ or Zn2+ uptake regulation protein